MDLLIGDVFRNAARAVPGRTAAVLGEASISFGDLDRRANQTARALGVARGDRVLVWAATNLDVLPVFAALAKSGTVFAPMNPVLSTEEATETAAAARPTLVVSDRARARAAGAVATQGGGDHVELGGVAERAGRGGDGHSEAAPGSGRDTPLLV